MALIQGKKYALFRTGVSMVYCVKNYDFILIYEHNYVNRRNYDHDLPWIFEGYKDIVFLAKGNKLGSWSPYYFVLLRQKDGFGIIMELWSKTVILKDFNFDDYRGKYRVPNFAAYESNGDAIVRFQDTSNKVFSLYSLAKDYIFGPYKYEKAVEYQNGIVLDGKIAVKFDGSVYNLEGYEYNGEVYVNKEKDSYILIVDDEYDFYLWMDDIGDGNLIAETCRYRYKFNKENQKLKREKINYHGEDDWSRYSDIAYEGYSRLELGLDD